MKTFQKNIIILTSILLSLLLFTSCTLVDYDDPNPDETNFGYASKDVSNILNGTCAASGCHVGNSPVNGLSTETQSVIMNGSTSRPYKGGSYYGGDVIIPFNPSKSLLLQFVKGNITSKISFNHKILDANQITTLENWIKDGAKNSNGDVPFDNPKSYTVYACNSASENLSVIDGTKNVAAKVLEVSDTTFTANTPYWVAEYGSYYYLTLSNSNKLLKVKKSDNTLVGVTSNLISAGMIKLSKDGTRAYISRASNSVSTYNSIYVVNTSNMSLRKIITFPFYGLPHGLALDITRNYLYVADAVNNMVHVINTLTDVVIDIRYSLTTNFYPLFIKTSPDGNYLYLSAKNTNELLVMNTQSRIVVEKIKLLPKPMGISVSNNGSKIYVASNGGNAIEVVTKTVNNWNKSNTITHPTMNMPFALDITSDNNYLYVTNQNSNGKFIPTYKVKGEKNISTITIINTVTEAVIKSIEVEEEAAGIVVQKQ